ncbi:hypothetical protein O181_054415 [Austropuccinia psidii MF-1]|uniref:Uncharacterized protein n=1 Tax=Austropuccinia psidii MF-1 TaxID=1389203 RepID=A0A9Q3E8T2_9BASI|nr:hypothetical protein [Austropuccinia psidii MF-1]
MVEFYIKNTEQLKLDGANFLDRQIRMKSNLQMKRLYSLVLGIKEPVMSVKLNKLEPEKKALASKVIFINCDVKISGQLSAEENNNPVVLWWSIDEFYQPKTIQNQTTYLKRIFSIYLPKEKSKESLNKLLKNTQHLCSLIDDKTTKSSLLLGSVVAM